MKSQILFYTIVMIAVALLGEWRIILFDHDFRFSLAVIFFTFILLWRRDISPLLLGFLIGSFVVIFRIGIDIFYGLDLSASFWTHIPAFFFYFIYSTLFLVFKITKIKKSLLLTAGLLVIIEVLANVVELQLRGLLVGFTLHFSDLNKIIFIALIRSSAALGFYTFLLYREAVVSEEATKSKNEKILAILSDLYGETIQVKNSISEIEHLTKYSQNTYKELQKSPDPETKKIAESVLWISIQIHELQKSHYRINAGLQQIITTKISKETMNISELVEFVKNSNEKYTLHLNKDIQFITEVDPKDYDVYLIKMLPVIQNLVINSAEAIDSKGVIHIKVLKNNHMIDIHIIDDGPGIGEEEKEDIFHLGYSTKFKSDGTSSTGIGLYYVKQIVNDLGGHIDVKNNEMKGAYMLIELPFEKVKSD